MIQVDCAGATIYVDGMYKGDRQRYARGLVRYFVGEGKYPVCRLDANVSKEIRARLREYGIDIR